jgi:biopolymer transport protein ExbB/TolQ
MVFPLLQAVDAAAPTLLQQAADVAVIVLAVFGIVGLLMLLVLLKQIVDVGRSARKVIRDLEKKVDPVVERSRVVAANVEFVSAAIRTDVERVNASVRSITERLHQASDQMEERVEEFNALLEVVQSEAEGMFIDTASTVRGLRAGARQLGAPRHPAPVDGPDDALED